MEKCGLGENPQPVIANAVDNTSLLVIDVDISTAEKNVLTGLVRKSDSDYNDFLLHQGKSYIMQSIPTVNLMDIKYFLPMVGGDIDGFYKVEKLSFGKYKDIYGNKQPCLKLKLGNYINLGQSWVAIYRIMMQPGEVISIENIEKMYNKEL